MFFSGVLLSLLLSLVSCTTTIDSQLKTSEVQVEAKTTDIKAFSVHLVLLLRDRKMGDLARYICPEKGLSFSPYAYIEQKAVNIKPSELVAIWQRDPLFHWGYYDGSGEPIELLFSHYFLRFVYSADYAGTHRIAVNKRIATGNTIDNIPSVFPKASFVEFNVPGIKPEFQGMDWRSLILVLEKSSEDSLCLVAILNDQWTI